MSVEGYLGHDQLIHDGNVHQLVHFGCAHKAIHFQNINRFAGVIGVANLARGLTRFSYCLFAGGEATRRGFLRFGTDVPPNLHYMSTRILPVHGAHVSGHYVSLVGVSVGARRLGEIRPETFTRHEDGQGGCVIDLDTPLTVLVQEAYDVVEEAQVDLRFVFDLKDSKLSFAPESCIQDSVEAA
nr:unnamed protein product [Digitaria exilis]